MATDKEYKAVIDALSGECEKLHKENEKLKALSQEPCTDAVSRDAILEWCGDINMDVYTDEVKEFVNGLPSVTQKSGKWLMTGEVDVYYDLPSYECSKCGKTSLENGDYCPNCGAKMESEVNNG